MEQCQYCSNMFGDKKILHRHQKNTKYCLKIQEERQQALAKALDEAKERKEAEDLILKELTCQFCSKQFKTKYLLSSHQKQAKYCIKIQESQNSQEIIPSLVTCSFCKKNFSTSNFNRHDSTCKKKNQSLTDEINRLKENDKEKEKEKDQEISILKMKAEKDQEISILKMKAKKDEEISSIYKAVAERAHATIEEIAKQPTYQKNSTRNIQNNLMIAGLTPLDLAQARVNSIIDEKYTKNDFYGGQKSVAEVIHKYLTTDSNGKSQIVCTDTERGTFHHIDVNGEHVVDYKNRDLIEKVHLPLKRKACEFAAEEYVKNPSASKEIITSENSIRELESKPGLFNRTMAQLTGKNCAKQLITETDQPPDLSITEELLENDQLPDLSITEEWLLENAKFLTIEHILRGPEGYADYALSYPLKDRLIEEDDLDNTFLKYIDKDSLVIIDYGANKFTKMLFDSIKDKNKLLIGEYESISVSNHEKLDIECSIFRNDFVKILLENL